MGAPLVASNGHRLGSLCIMDTQPREMEAGQAMILGNLAEMVVRKIELDIHHQLHAPSAAPLTRVYGQKFQT
ncbi:protein kinase domain-containing protein [Haematococcus lacustris]|uniref:Protein kinase domain-containing protein n=1 Tax=Haematococcus lacustris TaxID=44745 RepID=A0A699ZK95_HAELA|nr:protein kinase domain-containing protein [Haematococcus lacustris]